MNDTEIRLRCLEMAGGDVDRAEAIYGFAMARGKAEGGFMREKYIAARKAHDTAELMERRAGMGSGEKHDAKVVAAFEALAAEMGGQNLVAAIGADV